MPAVPYRQAPLVFLLMLVAVLGMTWPWLQTFSNAMLNHWDPPFHAWKLEYVARAILNGHLLPPDGNTNMYYPYSGTLYYEALHWPQALLAAPLFGWLNLNPVLVYHVILVLFWALTGVCTWMLMLALGSTRRSALLGALLFTIIPYRISYMVEFNMQLNFGIPLFFFFMVRYFQRPAIRYACGMALAWWLQAISELYQAVFLLLILPFPALALMANNWHLLKSFRRFWLPGICAAILGGALTWLILRPYLTMLHVHAVNRGLQEIATHVLEPLSFLRPGGRFHYPPPMDARRDEMIVYPTVALILLNCLHVVNDTRRLLRHRVSRWLWLARVVRWLALIAFFLVTFGIYFFGAPAAGGNLYGLLPVIAILFSVLVLVRPTSTNPATLFMTGFFSAAVFAFFLSFGPGIRIRHAHFGTPNWLYLWIYNHLDALQGFRVVSRFSVYVLLFMVLAGALAWSRIERRWLRHGLRKWLWLVPLALAIPECLPQPFKTTPLEYPLATPVMQQLDQLPGPYVLAMAPMGDRALDSRYMLQIARTDRLFVYAWGGAYPDYTTQVGQAMAPAKPQPALAANLLRQVWPPCYILEDKSVTRKARIPYNYVELFAGEASLVAEDNRFALLKLNPPTEPAAEAHRMVRHDYLVQYPCITFSARTPAGSPPVTLWLDLNGYVIGRWTIGPEARDIHVDIPARYAVKLTPNLFRFRTEDAMPFFLDSFAAARHPGPLTEPALDCATANCPLPLGHIHQIPAEAIPLKIRFTSGFRLIGCEPLQTTAPAGGAFRLRYYLQCPRDLEIITGSVLATRVTAASGKWVEERSIIAAVCDLNDLQCQIHPGIYTLEQTIQLPEHFAPGDYVLSVLLRTEKGQRIYGMSNKKPGRIFVLPVPIRILAADD
ncbi:MAG: hypothetical protein KBI43_02035 [Kiritimatiellae bacterium]|jgi:hypothetical protein|nr:hypothetical protein [Kiritimatiellia bacterium]